MKFTMWEEIVDGIAQAFKMDTDARERLRAGAVPRLIAAIPFLADCDDPLRTAFSHLGTYILALKLEEVFECKESDNDYLFRRLEMISNYIGGNPEIIKKGMSLLALNMIADYNRDIEEDRRLGKYNPVDTGAVNFDREKKKLITSIKAVVSQEMDDVLSIDEALKGWWHA